MPKLTKYVEKYYYLRYQIGIIKLIMQYTYFAID
jgi:hypothetical protein